ncbi:MAG: hypothetical protein E6Q97_19185 [Desulfurellales bacterium]|nr:MAG: hypothetical protein E6Q97_19185 [Desulfurellales bacterium]
MILDAFLQFTGGSGGVGSTSYSDEPTTGTQNSSNVIDLGIDSGIPSSANGGGARDLGIGDKPALKMVVQVLTTFVGGTSLQIALAGAVDNGTGSPSSYNNFWLSPAYAEATLVAGARLYDMDMPRPPAGIAIPRFLRLAYITVGTHTAGAIQAWLALDRDDQPYQSTNNAVLGGYPPGLAVSN